MLDLKRRQIAFHRLVEPSLRELEFDAEIVARWFLLGSKWIVVDPKRAFGRPISASATTALGSALPRQNNLGNRKRLKGLKRAGTEPEKINPEREAH